MRVLGHRQKYNASNVTLRLLPAVDLAEKPVDLAAFPQKYIPYPGMKGVAQPDGAAGSTHDFS